jgi:hypothetical protein
MVGQEERAHLRETEQEGKKTPREADLITPVSKDDA